MCDTLNHEEHMVCCAVLHLLMYVVFFYPMCHWPDLGSVLKLVYTARGWWNVEIVPTLIIFFLWIWLIPLPTIYSMFSKFQCFFWMFFCHINLISVLIPSIYLTINLWGLYHAQQCSVHESWLGGTYVGNYWKQWVLWFSLLPLISLSGLVRIGSGNILYHFNQLVCHASRGSLNLLIVMLVTR